MPTVVNVVGARPQFVKAGPVSRALAEAGIEEVLLNTGQHYDDLMADAIMVDVGLRQPDIDLGVGSDTHGRQTARMLEGIERALMEVRPDGLLTYGDTNSTVAGALASTKLGIFTGHVEAGLRSFNRDMPEELNRVATDHLSDLLLAPTPNAMNHLQREGLESRAVMTGDVMVDALMSVDLSAVEIPEWAAGEFYAATIHRPSNTDERARLNAVLEAFDGVDKPVHLLAHPRLRQRISDFGLQTEGGVHLHDPLPYSQMLRVVSLSAGLLTDSGGLQKEAFILGTPCTTIRTETEWTETLTGSWNVLAGERLDELAALVTRDCSEEREPMFGDGRAGERIVSELERHL
jgi:UDP-N-acetylglucosamine 2-epimerase (non-hydrolysing)